MLSSRPLVACSEGFAYMCVCVHSWGEAGGLLEKGERDESLLWI